MASHRVHPRGIVVASRGPRGRHRGSDAARASPVLAPPTRSPPVWGRGVRRYLRVFPGAARPVAFHRGVRVVRGRVGVTSRRAAVADVRAGTSRRGRGLRPHASRSRRARAGDRWARRGRTRGGVGRVGGDESPGGSPKTKRTGFGVGGWRGEGRHGVGGAVLPRLSFAPCRFRGSSRAPRRANWRARGERARGMPAVGTWRRRRASASPAIRPRTNLPRVGARARLLHEGPASSSTAGRKNAPPLVARRSPPLAPRGIARAPSAAMATGARLGLALGNRGLRGGARPPAAVARQPCAWR